MRVINESIVEDYPLGQLAVHPRNVNEGDAGAIYESIEANGFYGTIVVQKSTGYILAGNHRFLVARQQEAATLPVCLVDVDDDQALRILLADNRTTRLGIDNPAALAQLLQELLGTSRGLEGTGYDRDAMDLLLSDLGGYHGDADEDFDPDDADPDRVRDDSILDLVGLSIAEPRHKVERGTTWRIGPHVLVCDSVISGWANWRQHLGENCLFCPYAGPFILVCAKAKTKRLVIVQPDSYIAGHILDRYEDVNGKEGMTCL
jgi:hypothetical protein